MNVVDQKENTRRADESQLPDLVFAVSAAVGCVAGVVLGSAGAETFLGGDYSVALAVAGGLAGCWALAGLAASVLHWVSGRAGPQPVEHAAAHHA